MQNLPIIRLEVTQLRETVVAAIQTRHAEIQQLVDDQIESAVDAYPWQDEVQAAVHRALSKAIREHFEYGEGRRAIQNAVDQAISG
jgi:hypothetical protein